MSQQHILEVLPLDCLMRQLVLDKPPWHLEETKPGAMIELYCNEGPQGHIL